MMTLTARALAVKMLKPRQIEKMHERELVRFQEHGFYQPYELASLGGHDSIKTYWGAPSTGAGLERWAAGVNAQVSEFLHRVKPARGGDPENKAMPAALEEMHVFDWTIHHDSRVDFRYDAAPRTAVPEEAF